MRLAEILLILLLILRAADCCVAANVDKRQPGTPRVASVVSSQPVPVSDAGSGTYWWAHMESSPSAPGTIMVCGTRSISARNAAEGYVYLSTDYGKTWRQVLVDAATKWVSEQSCAFGSSGTAYFLSSRSAFFHGLPHHDQGHSRLYHSSDNGISWTSGPDWPFIDYSSTSVDLRGSASHDLIYIFANDVDTNDSSSGPGLLTLTPSDLRPLNSVLVPKEGELGRLYFAGPSASAVLDDGEVIGTFSVSRSSVAGRRPWADRSSTRHLIEVVRSEDNGRALQIPIPVSDIRRFGQLSESTIAVDRGFGVHHGRIYLSWAENSQQHIGIMLATSDDSGRTWHRHAVRQLSDPTRQLGLGSSPGITPPSVAVNQEGVVAIFWVEHGGRCPYFAASADGGSSFTAPTRIGPCKLSGLRDLSWYSHYLFTWPESEASEQGAERDESRVGLRIQMRVESLTPTSMVADDQGDFHAMWQALREGGSQLWTSAVNVKSSPSLQPRLPPGLFDLSGHVALEVANSQFDSRSKTISVDVTVVNRGDTTIRGPLLVRPWRIESTLGAIAPSQTAVHSPDTCTWTSDSHVIGQSTLAPGAWSAPVRIRTRFVKMRLTDKGDVNISLVVCGYGP